VSNPEEADRVKATFALYLQHRSVDAVLAEMQVRWMTKRWTGWQGAFRATVHEGHFGAVAEV